MGLQNHILDHCTVTVEPSTVQAWSNGNAWISKRMNPLQTTLTKRGIVSSRVALLLRSAEIKPLFEDLLKRSMHSSSAAASLT